jgi:hypothetical protein
VVIVTTGALSEALHAIAHFIAHHHSVFIELLGAQ